MGKLKLAGKQHKKQRIGIMGGTFDPIHFGHLVTAEAARVSYSLDQVVFVPSGKPPHKKDYAVTDEEIRYLMTILAVVTNPHFCVSRVEIDRLGYSYTVDTIMHFKKAYGEETELFFITGADAILEILTWKRVEGLLGHCRFIAATRPGFDLAGLGEVLEKLPGLDGNLDFLEVPALAISSTDIRRRVSQGDSIKYLLPETVEYFILKNGLYGFDIEGEE